MSCIVFVAGSYQPKQCGVAHYTAHLRENLAKQGIPSLILTTHAAAQTTDEPEVLGSVNNWHLSNLIPLIRSIHKTKASVLHIQHAAGTYGFDRAIFLLPLLLKRTSWTAPIITTVHEYGWWEWQPKGIPPQLIEWLKTYGQKQLWWDREDGFLLTQSNAIITTTNEIEQIIHHRLPSLKAQVHRIPIAANVAATSSDRSQARQTIRNQLGWSEDAAIVAFFGFLHPVKGLELLLSAFKRVLSTHPHARLLLIGGVETLALLGEQANCYWNQLQAKIAELDLDFAVHMTGYLDEKQVSHYLSSADIGVLPFHHGVTLKSGSLLALMEHALPVIATRANPPDPELNNPMLLRSISPRQPNQLAEALSELLSNSCLRQQLGSAGYAFSRQFTWSHIANAHLEIYQSVGYSPK